MLRNAPIRTKLVVALLGPLLVLAGAWLVRLAVEPRALLRLWRVPLFWPIVALVAASVVSTYFGEYRSLGVQFIYRLLMGAMVYFTVWEVLRTRGRLFAALCTFVAAGLLSAVAGLLEFVPAAHIESLLRMFKPQPTTVGGVLRLSGTFEYANGAAAYFEMALPVLVAVFVPIAFISGLTGEFYRQFALTIAGVVLVLGVAVASLTGAGPAAAKRPADTQPPSVPQGLRITGTTQTTIGLAWNASIADLTRSPVVPAWPSRWPVASVASENSPCNADQASASRTLPRSTSPSSTICRGRTGSSGATGSSRSGPSAGSALAA